MESRTALYRHLFNRYWELVFRLFRRRGISEERGEELTRDVFDDVWKGMDRALDMEKAGEWIKALARNAVHAEWIRRLAPRPGDGPAAAGGHTSAVEILGFREQTLPPDRMEHVRAHLVRCRACVEKLVDLPSAHRTDVQIELTGQDIQRKARIRIALESCTGVSLRPPRWSLPALARRRAAGGVPRRRTE